MPIPPFGSPPTPNATTTIAGKVKQPLTTKGDIQVFSDTYTRLPVGTNGQVLESRSTEPTGLKWIDLPGSASFVRETPSGTVNGSNTAFDTAYDYVAGTIMVFRDGQLMKGGGADYTETDANTITFVTAPVTGSVLEVYYQKSVSTAGNADLVDGLNANDGEVEGTLVTYYKGWIKLTETFTYASATTITIATGGASRFQKGDKLRLKQGGSYKYFYIVTVADTLLTVTGGSDYTVANSAITDTYVSREDNPFGFPDWFAYTPTGPTNTTLAGRFRINGRKVDCVIKGDVTGTPDFTNMPTLPITASSNMATAGWIWQICGVGGYYDSGTASRVSAVSPLVIANTSVCTMLANEQAGDQGLLSATNPITWANGDKWWVWFSYEF